MSVSNNFKPNGPILGFDGLNAEYIVYISIGLALKIAKKKPEATMSKEEKWIIPEGKYGNVLIPLILLKSWKFYLVSVLTSR